MATGGTTVQSQIIDQLTWCVLLGFMRHVVRYAGLGLLAGCNGTSSKRKLEVLDQDAFLQKLEPWKGKQAAQQEACRGKPSSRCYVSSSMRFDLSCFDSKT